MQDAIFTVVAAVLHLGNATFVPHPQDDSQCVLENDAAKKHITWAAELLGVPVGGLHKSLTTKTIQTPEGPISTPITAAAAEFNRDSLSKTIYARLFDWLVAQVRPRCLLARLTDSIGVSTACITTAPVPAGTKARFDQGTRRLDNLGLAPLFSQTSPTRCHSAHL